VPRLDVLPKATLATIEGSVPAPHEPIVGCRFAGRCPLVIEKCRQVDPPLIEVAPGQAAACWRSELAPALAEVRA
jgi:peptide/nickel transport system ATP-binding protein